MAGTLLGIRYGGKANRVRYHVVGEWRACEHAHNSGIDIYRDRADLQDRRWGDTYEDGAYRVVADGKVALFFGETAWSDSRRLYDDLMTALRLR